MKHDRIPAHLRGARMSPEDWAAALEAHDLKAGEPHGLSVKEARYARENGLDLAKYAAWREARTATEAAAIDQRGGK